MTGAPRARRQVLAGSPPAGWRRRTARLATELLAPAPMAAGLLLVTSWHSSATALEAAKWGALAILFSSVLPFGFILFGVRRRRLSDHHVGVRGQRPLPLLVALASVLAGLLLLARGGAPGDVVALVGAGLAGLVVAIAITLFWKISIHVAVAAGTVVVLYLLFGPALLVLAPLVALSAWARVELRDHSPAQAAVGAAVGAAVAGVMFSSLR